MGTRSWQVALALVVVVHLLAQLFGAHTLAHASQVLLVPTLAGVVWSAAVLPSRAAATRAYAGALVFSWLGDATPQLTTGPAAFIAMVGCFLVAQVFLVITYVCTTRRRPKMWVLGCYLVVFAVLYTLCAGGAGKLLPLVALYGVVLVAAGAWSSTVSPVTAAGGVLFVLSDSLIALNRFASWYALPAHDFLVMLTYIAALILIAYGLMRHAADSAASEGIDAANSGRAGTAGANPAGPAGPGSAQPGHRGGERPA